jgi:hypothetical protein
MSISFKVSKEDAVTIQKIAERAQALSMRLDRRLVYDLINADMDITAVHVNCCPLDLIELLAADDANFGHDVFGIRRHLDRNTATLQGCFLPRFSAVQS